MPVTTLTLLSHSFCSRKPESSAEPPQGQYEMTNLLSSSSPHGASDVDSPPLLSFSPLVMPLPPSVLGASNASAPPPAPIVTGCTCAALPSATRQIGGYVTARCVDFNVDDGPRSLQPICEPLRLVAIRPDLCPRGWRKAVRVFTVSFIEQIIYGRCAKSKVWAQPDCPWLSRRHLHAKLPNGWLHFPFDPLQYANPASRHHSN